MNNRQTKIPDWKNSHIYKNKGYKNKYGTYYNDNQYSRYDNYDKDESPTATQNTSWLGVEKDKLRVLIKKEVMLTLAHTMDVFNLEIGCILRGAVDMKNKLITVEAVEFPLQTSSGAECTFDEKEEGMMLVNHDDYIGIWHSHVKMGAFFSGQDTKVINQNTTIAGQKFLSIVFSKDKGLPKKKIMPFNLNSKDVKKNILNDFILNLDFEGAYFIKEGTVLHKYPIEIIYTDSLVYKKEVMTKIKKRIEEFKERNSKYVPPVKVKPIVEKPILAFDGERLRDFVKLYPELDMAFQDIHDGKDWFIEGLVRILNDGKLLSYFTYVIEDIFLTTFDDTKIAHHFGKQHTIRDNESVLELQKVMELEEIAEEVRKEKVVVTVEEVQDFEVLEDFIDEARPSKSPDYTDNPDLKFQHALEDYTVIKNGVIELEDEIAIFERGNAKNTPEYKEVVDNLNEATEQLNAFVNELAKDGIEFERITSKEADKIA